MGDGCSDHAQLGPVPDIRDEPLKSLRGSTSGSKRAKRMQSADNHVCMPFQLGAHQRSTATDINIQCIKRSSTTGHAGHRGFHLLRGYCLPPHVSSTLCL